MISYLRGKLIELGKTYIILDVNGVGYKVNMPVKMIDSIADKSSAVNYQGRELNLFTKTVLNQREGLFEIYGFPLNQDLEIFELLTSISGIGPKNALNIMSSLKIEELVAAVSKDDADYLRKVSGLGPKTAKRLVVELKDKFDRAEIARFAGFNLTEDIDAIDALVSLGYSKEASLTALRKISGGKGGIQEKVKQALKILNSKI